MRNLFAGAACLLIIGQAEAGIDLGGGQMPAFPETPTLDSCRGYAAQVQTRREVVHSKLGECYRVNKTDVSNSEYTDCDGKVKQNPFPTCHPMVIQLCRLNKAWGRVSECNAAARNGTGTSITDLNRLLGRPGPFASRLLGRYIKAETQRHLDVKFGEPLSPFQADKLTGYVNTYMTTGRILTIRNPLVREIVRSAHHDLEAHRNRMMGELTTFEEMLDDLTIDDSQDDGQRIDDPSKDQSEESDKQLTEKERMLKRLDEAMLRNRDGFDNFTKSRKEEEEQRRLDADDRRRRALNQGGFDKPVSGILKPNSGNGGSGGNMWPGSNGPSVGNPPLGNPASNAALAGGGCSEGDYAAIREVEAVVNENRRNWDNMLNAQKETAKNVEQQLAEMKRLCP